MYSPYPTKREPIFYIGYLRDCIDEYRGNGEFKLISFASRAMGRATRGLDNRSDYCEAFNISLNELVELVQSGIDTSNAHQQCHDIVSDVERQILLND